MYRLLDVDTDEYGRRWYYFWVPGNPLSRYRISWLEFWHGGW